MNYLYLLFHLFDKIKNFTKIIGTLGGFMKLKYSLGITSYTKEMELNNNVLDKQLKISFPLITSVHVLKRKATLKNIYVGKEIG
mgnify:CR=1 FL=1